MKRFSVMDAVGEPFRQAGRRPVATIVWGLVLLLPSVAILGMMGPIFGQIATWEHAGASAHASVWAEDFEAMLQFQFWSWLAQIAGLLTVLLVTTAIARSVFAGRKGDSLSFLRIGKDEFHVAVIGITVFVGFILVMGVGVLVALALGFALSQAPGLWRGLAYAGMALAGIVAGCLLWGRLSLLAPAAIRYRTLAFEEGWKLGRGQTWRLFGLMLMILLVCLLIGLACILLMVIVLMAIGGGVQMSDPDAMTAWVEGLAEKPAVLIGIGLVMLLPLAWIQGFSQLLVTAPYARAVAALAKEPEAPTNSTDTLSDPL